MPISEYACTSCGERTEAKQGFDDPPLEECSQCGGRLRKLYSPVGIVFKGSGFYSTDAKGAKKSTSTETKSTDSKTDTKKTDSDSQSAKAEKKADKTEKSA